jgi:hypothetical protein
MNEAEDIEQSQQEKNNESKEQEVNETILQEQTIEQPQTENYKPQTENMEVHHHPNLHHRKKQWKEYFLEFLMIFLAVTLGFFAESYREHLGDRSKEKEYINSMMEDLRTDSAFLELSINKLIPYHIKWIDSTVHLFQMPDLKGKDKQVYQAFFIASTWAYNFHPTQRTLSQLHSEGFHLIRNTEATKAISNLEQEYNVYNPFATFIDNLQSGIDISAAAFADRNVVDTISRVIFKNFYNDPFVHLQLSDIPASAKMKTYNRKIFKLCAEKLDSYSFYIIEIKTTYTILLDGINSTIGVLKKEYNLQ